MIARDTGWGLEYIQSLPEYWRLILMGWTPALSREEIEAENERMLAAFYAAQQRQGGFPPHARR